MLEDQNEEKVLQNLIELCTLETCMAIVKDKGLKIHWIIINLVAQQWPHKSAN